MISSIILSCIIAQTLIAIYLVSILKLKTDFEKTLNAILVILFFHLGTKFFILVILKNKFLYENNASGFGLSYGPLLYIATRIFDRKPLAIRAIIYHMMPFVLCTLIYFVNGAGYLFHTISADFINSYAFIYQWFVAVSLLVYPVLSLMQLRNYDGAKNESLTLQSNLLKNISVVMLIGIISGLSGALVHYIRTGFHDFDVRLIPYISLAAIPVLILRYKMKDLNAPVAIALTQIEQVPAFVNELSQQDLLPEKRYRKSALDEEMMDKYELSLNKFIQKTKIYLEPEISLEELSAKSGIPKHHLTQLLNERLQKNFYSFINEYRIAEAVEKLKNSNETINILSLAYDCGFNSKSSFNNYFKKVTGFTPSAYRKEHNLQSLNEELIVS
ncbi:MAG: AraC family transcriptional regulator [Chitinophagaceae bacterium]